MLRDPFVAKIAAVYGLTAATIGAFDQFFSAALPAAAQGLEPILAFGLCVVLGLLIYSAVALPLLLRLVGIRHPFRLSLSAHRYSRMSMRGCNSWDSFREWSNWRSGRRSVARSLKSGSGTVTSSRKVICCL